MLRDAKHFLLNPNVSIGIDHWRGTLFAQSLILGVKNANLTKSARRFISFIV